MIFLYIIVVGMVAGWLADVVLHRGATRAQQLAAGLIGSFVGGTAASLLAGDGFGIHPSGLIGSFVGALVVLAVWNPQRVRSR